MVRRGAAGGWLSVVRGAGVFAREARAGENRLPVHAVASAQIPARFGPGDAKGRGIALKTGRGALTPRLESGAVNVGAHVVQLFGLLLEREVHQIAHSG